MNFSVSAKEVKRAEAENLDETEVVEDQAKWLGTQTKKILVITSMICGGMAFLLWSALGFPTQTKNIRTFKQKTCTWDATVCPEGWNRVHNNCFFRSEEEKSWKAGLAVCMAYQGTLVIFRSQNEVDFLTHYLGTSSYWIGLKKQHANEHWMWANGDALSNWFTIKGNGSCAFIYKKGLSSANCDDEKKYICSRKGICP